MIKEVTDIRQAVQVLSGFNDLAYEGVICRVSDIDLVLFTCTCTPIDGGAEFYDVLLNANADKGFTLIPADNSVVIVQQISSTNAYVSMVSKVDQIYLAGDVNGGLVKVTPLVAAYNSVVTDLLTIQLALNGLGAPIAVTSTTKTNSDFENSKVKHGNG